MHHLHGTLAIGLGGRGANEGKNKETGHDGRQVKVEIPREKRADFWFCFG